MQIMGTGINHSTGRPLVEPIDEQEFAGQIRNWLSGNREEVENVKEAVASVFRDEVEVQPSTNLNDPLTAGWTFLVNGDDPQYDDIKRVLRPLAEHRGMDDPDSPLEYNGEQSHEWADWRAVNYSSSNLPGAKERPHYILIVGDPDRVPFKFQSFLDSAASVGRVDFDSIDDLDTYVQKLIGLERAEPPATERKAVCFAPDGGWPLDPTYYSRPYMGERFAEHIRATLKFDTTALMAENATKQQFLDSLDGARPALVFTASHGDGEVESSFEIQKKLNGAIVCQDDKLITSEDVPFNEPFLEGAVFFQFACFGYGTPGVSHFAHWQDEPAWRPHPDFVAALPKRLLAHPRGPVAFVGHVDTAWLLGFLADPDDPPLPDVWQPRILPYLNAINSLLRPQPVGQAMIGFNERYSELNDVLTRFYDDVKEDPTEYAPAYLKRGKSAKTPTYHWLVDTFILRTDAQDYMIFGDPAIHIRLPDE